jgi:hypothetical protein
VKGVAHCNPGASNSRFSWKASAGAIGRARAMSTSSFHVRKAVVAQGLGFGLGICGHQGLVVVRLSASVSSRTELGNVEMFILCWFLFAARNGQPDMGPAKAPASDLGPTLFSELAVDIPASAQRPVRLGSTLSQASENVGLETAGNGARGCLGWGVLLDNAT